MFTTTSHLGKGRGAELAQLMLGAAATRSDVERREGLRRQVREERRVVRQRLDAGPTHGLARAGGAEEVEDAEQLADVRVAREEHRALVRGSEG